MDIWSKQKRSEVMSKIRGKNTKPEMILRSKLFSHGFRFRVHRNDLPGKPDIVLPKYKTIIFVHGCFWHNHQDCREGRIPSTNSNYWSIKLKKNITKDAENEMACKNLGYKVIVVWECEIEKKLDELLSSLIHQIML